MARLRLCGRRSSQPLVAGLFNGANAGTTHTAHTLGQTTAQLGCQLLPYSSQPYLQICHEAYIWELARARARRPARTSLLSDGCVLGSSFTQVSTGLTTTIIIPAGPKACSHLLQELFSHSLHAPLPAHSAMPVRLPTWSIDEDVYHGLWVDRSTHSARLTLDRQAGGVVIAFLALFVAATARSLWKITRFLLHAALSSSRSQHGSYHQTQAILRNQSLARDALLDLLRLSYVWRDRVHGVRFRTLPIALIACLISVASVAAGKPRVFATVLMLIGSRFVVIENLDGLGQRGSYCWTRMRFDHE